MKAFSSIIAAACLAVGSIGCGSGDGIVAPSAIPKPQSPTRAQAPTSILTDYPALTHPGAVYTQKSEESASDAAYHGTLTSRYVIYYDGSFDLQYISERVGFFSYAGTYTESGMVLTLNFRDGNGATGPWVATGTRSGNQMNVKYNLSAGLADFDDAVYVRVDAP
jgi:hypothetical protein